MRHKVQDEIIVNMLNRDFNTISAISKKIDRTYSRVSNVIKRLTQDGLVMLEVSGRNRKPTLTKFGMIYAKAIKDVWDIEVEIDEIRKN